MVGKPTEWVTQKSRVQRVNGIGPFPVIEPLNEKYQTPTDKSSKRHHMTKATDDKTKQVRVSMRVHTGCVSLHPLVPLHRESGNMKKNGYGRHELPSAAQRFRWDGGVGGQRL